MKKFIKENWFKIILAVCAVIIAFGYLWSVRIEAHREDRLSLSKIEKRINGLDF